jgi:hypothetical protein
VSRCVHYLLPTRETLKASWMAPNFLFPIEMLFQAVACDCALCFLWICFFFNFEAVIKTNPSRKELDAWYRLEFWSTYWETFLKRIIKILNKINIKSNKIYINFNKIDIKLNKINTKLNKTNMKFNKSISNSTKSI